MAKDDLSPVSGPIQPAFYLPQLDGVTDAGQAVIQANAGIIGTFVGKQRDAVKLGGLDQHRAVYTSPDLDIEYHHNFGQERILLTPYVTPPTDVPYTPPPINPGDPPTFTEPPIVIPDTSYPCMLVLYKTNCWAAIPMGSLAPTAQGLVPVYLNQDLSSSFSQPVKTGQYRFSGLGFIQTDVDLTGQGGKKSMLSSTFLYDAVSLGAQYTPILNSSFGTAGTLTASIPVYSSQGSYTWNRGKLTLTTANQNTEQCSAIDQQGTLYYGQDFDAPQISLTMNDTTLDDDIMESTLAELEEEISTYVMVYTVNYIRWIDSNNQTDVDNTVLRLWNTNPNLPGGGYYSLFYAQPNKTQSTTLAKEYIYENATPVPGGSLGSGLNGIAGVGLGGSGQSVPLNPTDANDKGEINITEVLGSSYYATATYTDDMTIQSPKLSYDNVYYYGFSLDDNYYENLTVPVSQPDFSGSFPRLAFDPTAHALTMVQDNVSANAVNTYTLDTLVVQDFPEWGGYLLDGGPTSLEDNTTYYDYDYGSGIRTHDSETEQIVAHTTILPSNYSGGYINLTYGQVQDMVANIVGQLASTGGPSVEYSGAITTISTTLFVQPYGYGKDGNPILIPPYEGETTSTNETDGSGANAKPPGYKAQIVDQEYNGSISWLGASIVGYNSSTDVNRYNAGEITCEPFPPGTPQQAYYTQVTQVDNNDPEYIFNTPYMTTGQTTTQPTFTGWMHVCNNAHYLQGFILNEKPYIYLDGTDITQMLADNLNCDPTDIAACYFDIDLATIKLLGGIK